MNITFFQYSFSSMLHLYIFLNILNTNNPEKKDNQIQSEFLYIRQ